jgi:predicted dehydrogenase
MIKPASNVPIRVAIAGTGYFSRFHIEAWNRLDGVELVGGWNRTRQEAAALLDPLGVPVFDDAVRMLDEVRPDLLDIAGSPPIHLPLIKLAAERGIDVICQKPFCQTPDEAREAVAVANAAGIRVVVHENFRFQPWYRAIARVLASGELGQVYQMTFRLRPGDGQGEDAYLARQPFFRTMERFLIRETATHLVDTFRFLLGPIRAVTADLRRLNPTIAGEDAGIVIFGFDNGVRAVFDGNRLADHAATNTRLTMGEMVIDAERGSLRLDGFGGVFIRPSGQLTEKSIAFTFEDRNFGADCVYLLQKHVIKALRGQGTLENEARDYLNVIRVEQAIYDSADSGRRIELEAE